MKQYVYICSNSRCGLLIIYSTAQTKDINCPTCTHKTAISNRNVVVLDVPLFVDPTVEPLIVDPVVKSTVVETYSNYRYESPNDHESIPFIPYSDNLTICLLCGSNIENHSYSQRLGR